MVQTSLDVFQLGNESGKFDSYREEIYSFLARNSFYSFTSYEISIRLGINILNVRPRLTELQKENKIEKAERRANEYTWRIKDGY